ncbi:hypothetical protein [Parasphingorhabdus halotolerans]|uniref:Uncharacterized protein n=1 Tax=Parasphingorhabdus halotolerans TaxID=2725558 RepID=A0A6H2DJT0_9SPHN|nr:hypothetical protein [Parasphingorhabdus halotolerans]QJB68243.1 hypothetical protein HF685_02105 [Parasphingorhabdus halotolerans]
MRMEPPGLVEADRNRDPARIVVIAGSTQGERFTGWPTMGSTISVNANALWDRTNRQRMLT